MRDRESADNQLFFPISQGILRKFFMTHLPVEKIYTRLAPVYNLIYGWALDRGRRHAVGQLGDLKSSRVLELGIGTGRTLSYYPHDVCLTAVDLSPKMLKAAEEHARRLNLKNVAFLRMDATRMDFADNTFDKAIGSYFITVAENPGAVIHEISRVVKPGGTVVLISHFRSSNPLISWLEKRVSPVGFYFGWGLQHDIHHILNGTPLKIEAIGSPSALNFFKTIRCVNAK